MKQTVSTVYDSVRNAYHRSRVRHLYTNSLVSIDVYYFFVFESYVSL